MTLLTDEISAATDIRDPMEYIRRVKAVVLKEIVSLDPAAKIIDTQYFNHSAIPDFLVQWNKTDQERSFYIRDSMDSYLAGRDQEFLPNKSAGVITLDLTAPSDETMNAVSDAVEETPRRLLTTISAMDSFRNMETSTDPIAGLAKNLFVRGARGLVDENLVSTMESSPSDSEEDAEAAETLLLSHFVPESALVIRRTADLLRIVTDENLDDSNQVFEGALSGDELSRILPWVLKSSPSRAYLRKLGQMFSFADLENLSSVLQGYDLTALISANANRWTATRAYGGLYIPPENTEETTPADSVVDESLEAELVEAEQEDLEDADGAWNFRGTRLGFDLPSFGQRVEMVHSGRLLKGRPNQSSETWDSVEGKVKAYKPLRVDLRGLRRSVVINAEESDDIRQDVENITETVEDTYFVQSITVAAKSNTDTQAKVEVDFGQSLAIGECFVEDLLKISRDLLIRNLPDSDD